MSTTSLTEWLAHRPRRGMTCVDTAVLHASGTEDFEEYLHDLRSQDRSYHYVIDKDGTAHKCVPYSAVAFHAGNSWGPHEEARGIEHAQDSHGHFVELTSVNEYTIGICLMNRNDGSDPFVKGQEDGCLEILREVRAHLPKLSLVTTHALVSPGQHTDPLGLDAERLAKQSGLGFWSPSWTTSRVEEAVP